MQLKYEGIPNDNIHVFSTAVIDTLDKLGIKYDEDETSPPDEKNEVTYMVFGVKNPKKKKKKK